MERPGSFIWGGYHPDGIYRNGYSPTEVTIEGVNLDILGMKRDAVAGTVSIKKFEEAFKSAKRLRDSLEYLEEICND